MERVVNFPQLCMSEFVGDGGKDFCDNEWSFSFGSELGVWEGAFRCHPSSHTLDPFLKGWKFRHVLLFMVCLARSWVARASFLRVRREFRQS